MVKLSHQTVRYTLAHTKDVIQGAFISLLDISWNTVSLLSLLLLCLSVRRAAEDYGPRNPGVLSP